jgi:hypothetical protein
MYHILQNGTATYDIPDDYTGTVVHMNSKPGTKFFYKNGKLHRLDGPAAVLSHTQLWYFKGLRHRLDGPALKRFDGYTEFWILGLPMAKYMKIFY